MKLQDLLDRESIRHTLALYNFGVDGLDGDMSLGAFTDDIVFQRLDLVLKGREAIRSYYNGGKRPKPRDPSQPRGISQRSPPFRHHMTSCLIELVSPTEARAQTYYMIVRPPGPDQTGMYRDVLRKEGDRWLISHRVVEVHWAASHVTEKEPALLAAGVLTPPQPSPAGAR